MLAGSFEGVYGVADCLPLGSNFLFTGKGDMLWQIILT